MLHLSPFHLQTLTFLTINTHLNIECWNLVRLEGASRKSVLYTLHINAWMVSIWMLVGQILYVFFCEEAGNFGDFIACPRGFVAHRSSLDVRIIFFVIFSFSSAPMFMCL